MRPFLLIGGAVLTGLVVVGVVATVLLVRPDLGRPGEVTAKFLPGDTQVYFTINLRPGAGQLSKAKKISSIFRDTSGFDGRRGELLDDLDNETGIDFMDDVLLWIGKDVTLALLDTDSQSKPDWVLLLQTKDWAASVNFLQSWVQYLEDQMETVFDDRAYRGAIIYSEKDDELSFGVTREYVLFGSREGVIKKTIQALELPPSRPLSQDEIFLKVLDQLPSERFMLMFVRNDNSYLDIAKTGFEFLERFTESVPGLLGMSGSFIDQGIRLDLYSDTPSELVLVTSRNHLNTAMALPEDTLFMVSGVGAPESWQRFRDQLEEQEDYRAERIDSALDELDKETGINLERDVIEQLVGEITLALLPGALRFEENLSAFESGAIEVLLVAELGDSSGLKRALGMLVDFVEDVLAVGIHREDIGGYEAVTLDLSGQGGIVEEYSPGYLFTEDFIALGTTAGALQQMADALDKKAPSVRSAPEFSRLISMAPDNASLVAFADVAAIIDMVVDALPPGTRSRYEDDLRPFLEPLNTFFAAATVSDERTTTTLVLTVREAE